MKRKAQGLSLTTIIIALLVLLVLVVIGFIFMTQSNKFREGVRECSGYCVDSITGCDGKLATYMKDCKGTGSAPGKNYCCPPGDE